MVFKTAFEVNFSLFIFVYAVLWVQRKYYKGMLYFYNNRNGLIFQGHWTLDVCQGSPKEPILKFNEHTGFGSFGVSIFLWC